MKKKDPDSSNSESRKSKAENNQVINADSQNEQKSMNFLKRRQISAHMAHWFLDYEYNQLLWSNGIYEMLELNPQNFNGIETHLLNLIHPKDRHIKISALNELQKSSKPLEITYRLKFNDGRIKWISEICSTEFDEAGNKVRSFGTVLEITNYKLSKQSFKQRLYG